jgi:hypothetical protein
VSSSGPESRAPSRDGASWAGRSVCPYDVSVILSIRPRGPVVGRPERHANAPAPVSAWRVRRRPDHRGRRRPVSNGRRRPVSNGRPASTGPRHGSAGPRRRSAGLARGPPPRPRRGAPQPAEHPPARRPVPGSGSAAGSHGGSHPRGGRSPRGLVSSPFRTSAGPGRGARAAAARPRPREPQRSRMSRPPPAIHPIDRPRRPAAPPPGASPLGA